MNASTPNLSTGEKFYFGTFLFILITSGIPMLSNPRVYNSKMNDMARLFGISSSPYDVDSMPWRLRYKLLQDVLAMGAGVVTTCLGINTPIPMLVTITSFDVLGAITSGIVAVKNKIRAEWIPVASHATMGLWGMLLCWRRYSGRS